MPLIPITNRSSAPAFPVARMFFVFPLCVFALCVFAGCRDSSSKSNMNATPKTAVAFDGSRAFDQVKKQVDFGPRPAGSAELANTRAYLVKELESYGLKVTQDQFTPATPEGPKQMVNVTAEIAGETSEVIILGSHYDTKLYREFSFVGANDGASSTGVLLELARVLSAAPKPRYTYWLVFFDGEEAFCPEWDDCKNPDGSPDHLYGSRRFVQQLQARNEVNRVKAMILLDMVGYKALQFGRDDLGERHAPWLIDLVWQTAYDMGHGSIFQRRSEGVVGDDHEPFIRAGIPAIDIIQLSGYPHWHTAEDTLDKISPRSLKIVGDVVIASLPKLEEKLRQKAAK
jgi:Zn-dependent M28 family amino/carboxypeptidase